MNNSLMEHISIPRDNLSKRDRNSVGMDGELSFVVRSHPSRKRSWSDVNLVDEALVLSQAAQRCTESPSVSSISVEDPEDKQGQWFDDVDSAEGSDTTNPNTPSVLKHKRESEGEDEQEGFGLIYKSDDKQCKLPVIQVLNKHPDSQDYAALRFLIVEVFQPVSYCSS